MPLKLINIFIYLIIIHFDESRSGFTGRISNFGTTNRKKAERYDQYMKNYIKSQDSKVEDRRSVNEIAASIDTTLTEEQKAYVATIRRKIRGGDRTPRCNILNVATNF